MFPLNSSFLAVLVAAFFTGGPDDGVTVFDPGGADLQFEHLNVEHGLSQSTVLTIFQDRTGFLWIGTYIGLNRYDGFEFQSFRHDPNHPDSLPSDQVRALLEDRRDRLWIATDKGLCRLDGRDTDQPEFHHYRPDPGNPHALSHPLVLALYLDRQGVIWVGTPNGLNRYRPESDDFVHYTFDPQSLTGLIDPRVTDILEDQWDNLWVATSGGLTRFNPKRDRTRHHRLLPTELGGRYRVETLTRIREIVAETSPLAALRPMAGGERHDELMFTVERPTTVLAVGLGEADFDQWYDSGALYRDGQPIWKMERTHSKYAGGAPKNRLNLAVLHLEPGSYRLVFDSDDSHGGGRWNRLRPDDPSWWGISLIPLTLPADIGIDLYGLSGELLPSNGLSRLFLDRDQHLWLGSFDQGFSRVKTDRSGALGAVDQPGRFYRFPEIAGYHVSDMVQDNEGYLWISTEGGLSRLFPDGGAVHNFFANPFNSRSLSTSELGPMMIDRSGVIWIGSVLGGLNKFNPNKLVFEHYANNPYLQNSLNGNRIYAFAEGPGDVLWIGSRTGISAFHRGSRRFLPVEGDPSMEKKLAGLQVTALHRDHFGTLWIGTNRGLFETHPRLERAGAGGNKAVIRHGPLRRQMLTGIDSGDQVGVSTFWEDPDGTLWVATTGLGLLRTQLKKNKRRFVFRQYSPRPERPHSLSHAAVRGLFRDSKGALWVGTIGGGLNRYREQSDDFEVFMRDDNRVRSLSHNAVTCVAEADSLWVGTYGGGLNRFDPAGGDFTRFTEADGLPDNVVYGILPGEGGSLWLSTNRGLARLDPTADKISIKTYDIADGLQSNEFNQGAYLRCGDGGLLFGGINGFNLFYPKGNHRPAAEPHMVITGLKMFGERHLFSEPIYDLNYLSLRHSENFLSFEFAAMDFAGPEQNQYAICLEGIDRGWEVVEVNHSSNYTNLVPGNYSFRVKFVNHEGVWSAEEASLQLHIRPPFWQTLWFRLTVAFGAILSAFLAYRLRVAGLHRERLRQEDFSRGLIRAQERERGRIANELHDSLGQNLLVINNELQLQAQTSAAAPYRDGLNHLSELVRDSVEEVRQIAYNLRPHQLDRLGLKRALTSMVNRVAQAGAIDLALHLENVEGVLPKDHETHLFRIVQEGLNNVIKHAEATRVRLELVGGGREFLLKISDNGKGFEPRLARKLGTGMGLRTMAERVKLMQGSLKTLSGPGQGTRLWIRIPISQEKSHE